MKTLSIYDSRSNELIAVLQKHGSLPTVLEGDPDILPKFGLDRFEDLEDMERHVNGRMSLLHAVPDEDDQKTIEKSEQPGDTPQMVQEDPHEREIPENAKPEMPSEDVDARIKPAIDIIKRLLQVAEEKHKRQAEEQTQVDQAGLEQQSAKVAQEQPYMMYVSVDGDDIGNHVFQAEQSDDEEAIMEISNRINQGQDLIRQWAEQNGGKVIEAGGDEGLVKVPSMAFDNLEKLREQYKNMVKATLTVGVGKKISEAGAARQLGKLRGKNQVVKFDEGTKQELDTRMEQQDIDAKEKLKMLTQSGKTMGAPQGPQAEPEAEGEAPPKFAAPEGQDDQQSAYDKWVKDGMPEEQEEKEKPMRPPGYGRNEKRRKEEHRLATEMGRERGENPEFLKNALRQVRKGD